MATWKPHPSVAVSVTTISNPKSDVGTLPPTNGFRTSRRVPASTPAIRTDSVDLADYARFTDAYLLESLWLGANLDRTGPVDLTDLSLFSQEWLWAQP